MTNLPKQASGDESNVAVDPSVSKTSDIFYSSLLTQISTVEVMEEFSIKLDGELTLQ